MNFTDIKELHYICRIENLPSIFKYGILCHTKAEELKHEDVSMADVQARRDIKTVNGGMNLHSYVNLYFHARNPMMRKLVDEQRTDLCVLSIDKKVMMAEKAVLADRNAASGYARFFPSPEGLEYLNYDLIFAKYWFNENDDEVTKYKRKQAKCAEVLIPFSVGKENIKTVYVSNEATKKKTDNENFGVDVIIDKNLFFDEGEI